MNFETTTFHEVRSSEACAYYNGVSWNEQIDIVCSGLNGDYEFTAPSLLRAWERFEQRGDR